MVKLSILLVTFNHQNHIRQALDSIFGQNFKEPIELVVADDASTDATLAIIRTYEGRDPRFSFKYLPPTANLGITRNYQRGFAACTGEFVAVMEGDDYWTSREKLSRQIKFLTRYPECGLCAANYDVSYEKTGKTDRRIRTRRGHRFIDARELILDNLIGNFSACMYRKSALDALPAGIFEIISYDWIVNICIAAQGRIGFIHKPMSVYRVHASGAWSGHSDLEKLRLQLRLIPVYDQLTEHRFREEFRQLANRLDNIIAAKHTPEKVEAMDLPLLIAEKTMLLERLGKFWRPGKRDLRERLASINDQIEACRSIFDMP